MAIDTTLLNIIHCASWEDISPHIPDESVGLCVVDPPYGIDFVSNFRVRTEKFKKIAGDMNVDDSWIPEIYRALIDTGAIYLWTRWDVEAEWSALLKNAGFVIKNSIVWDKGGGGMGDLEGAWCPQHERCLFAVKGKHKLRGKRLMDVIRMPKIPPSQFVHPTQKPVELMELLIGASSDVGDIVVDFFAGSGPVLKACRRLNRNFIATEIDEKYAAIAQAGIESTKSRMLF